MAYERLPFSDMDPDRLRFMGRASFGGYMLALDILNRPEGYFKGGLYVEPLSHQLLTPGMARPRLLAQLAAGLGHVVQYADAMTVQQTNPSEDDFDSTVGMIVEEGYDSCDDIVSQNPLLQNQRPDPLADRPFLHYLRRVILHVPHAYPGVIAERHTATLLAGIPVSSMYPPPGASSPDFFPYSLQ